MTVASSVVTIKGSVGRHGKNRDEDVLTVQKLLNVAKAGIEENGDCDRGTIGAIEDYQRNWTKHPDGRVDPGGHAWKKLLEGKLKVKKESYIILPQACGNGYYSYSTMDRQYGTPLTVAALIDICGEFTTTYTNLQVGIGDMSFANGAKMSPHVTHRNGRNADIRPLRTDGKMLPVDIFNDKYSRDYTKALVEVIRAHRNFHSVLFNDTNIKGVTHWNGHDNHLHVTMKD